MSTRGAVACGTATAWRGVYNHGDSQPTGLAPAVWRALVAAGANGLAGFERDLVAAGRWERFTRADATAEPLALSSENADPLFIEWVYVVDAGVRALHILSKWPTSARFDAWAYELVGSFPLDGAEPDWAAVERAHRRRHAGVYLEHIRERFGDEAYRAARRQMLDDDAGEGS